jgi:hypothetical protein
MKTVRVESPQPAAVNSQNGSTARRRWALPDLPQTQCLFKRKAGTDIMLVARKLAVYSSNDVNNMSWRMTWVPATPTAEVAEYRRARRPASERAWERREEGVRFTTDPI